MSRSSRAITCPQTGGHRCLRPKVREIGEPTPRKLLDTRDSVVTWGICTPPLAFSSMAATSLHIAGLPALSNGSRKREMAQGKATGLRCLGDRMALRSSFYNAGASLPLSQPDRPRMSMRVATKDAYICRDCGYIYSDRKPFEKLPDDFLCPVCGAPKRRFKPYDAPVSKNANDQSVRKARKAELKKNDSALGGALPIGIAVGLAALLGVFFYLNGQY